jgi:polyphenol oxidase
VSVGAPAAHSYLTPAWPVPARVRAAFSLRAGGCSAAPFDTLNLGAEVGDAPASVRENRERLRAVLGLPAEPLWLQQVHGTEVLEPGVQRGSVAARADAVILRAAGQVAAIQVADCLPVLFAARDGSSVAAAHAGWRGLAAGVLEATVAKLSADPTALIAWLGPAIGPRHFEVGDEVRAALVLGQSAAASAFTRNPRGRWQCDLAALARQRLAALGVGEVFGAPLCTYADPQRFFSYRRDGRCGRMAALIWLS